MFKAAYRFTVLLALGVSAGCLSGSNGENSGGSADGAWTTKKSMNFPRSGLAVGVVGNVLYAVGGNNGSANVSTVEAYDPTTNTWSTKKAMSTARSGLAVGVVNGALYAIGGTNDGVNSLNTVEKYDPGTDNWTTVTPMSTARYGLGVGVVNDHIYAVGGFIALDNSSPVEAYDPVADTWVPRASMPHGRMLLGVGVVNDILCAVGGSTDGTNNLSTVEVYNTTTDQWDPPETPMPTPRGGLAAGVINGILYAIGGELGDINPKDTAPKAVEAYDPSTNKWTTKASMPTGRTLLAAGVINGTLYAVGGDDQGTVEAFTP